MKCHEAYLFKTKFSNVSVALIYTLSHNTRHIAFPNLELTCNIVYVHNRDLRNLQHTWYISHGWRCLKYEENILKFLQIYLSICTFLVWHLTSYLEKKYRVWPRNYVNLFQTWWKYSIYFYLEFKHNVYQWHMQAMKRTTMFRENKPLGHKHILRVDCMNDNQTLIMQNRILIVKIHEIVFKICWNRYVTSLEQIRYPIALSIWNKGFNRWSCIYLSVIEYWLLKVFHL